MSFGADQHNLVTLTHDDFLQCSACMEMCAHGKLLCFSCMATFLFVGPEPDTVTSPFGEELMKGLCPSEGTRFAQIS